MIDKIMISGRGGAGKDIVADYLVEKYGFKKIAFADGIYNIARKYFGMTYKDRALLQEIGEKMRSIDPLVWVNYAFNDAKQYDKVVISDTRRRNEYSHGLSKGYLPIRILADLDTRIERLEKRDGTYPDLELLENESETGADDSYFIELTNNSTLKDVYDKIDVIMNADWTDKIKQIQINDSMKQRY